MADFLYGSWSDTISYDKGKFKARVKYKVSDKAFTFGYDIKITDAFSKKQPFKIRFEKDGKWTDWKKPDDNKQDGEFSSAKYSLDEETVKIQIGVGKNKKGDPDKTVNVPKVERTAKANTPEKIKATKINDAHYELFIKGKAFPTVPTNKIEVERATDDMNNWSAISGSPFSVNSTSNYEKTIQDTGGIERNHKYKWRVRAVNNGGGNSGWRSTVDAKYTSPGTSVTLNVESFDGFNLISWKMEDVASMDEGIVQGWYVRVSVNGGAFEDRAKVKVIKKEHSIETDYQVEDRNLENGKKYKYRLVSFGKGGTSDQSVDAETEISTAPTPPIEVKAYRQSNDYITVTVYNSEVNSAEEVIIERQIDGGDWIPFDPQPYAPMVTYTDESAVAEDNIIYRALNQNTSGYSGYTVSDMVLVKSKPNSPLLTSPTNKSNVNIATDSIRLEWLHQPTDGTPQQNAKLQWRKNSGAWTTVTTIGINQYYDLSTSGLNSGDVIEWRVKTKGSFSEYSDYSDISTFTVRSNPEITITSPSRDETISELPIEIEFYYDGVAGNLTELRIDIIKNNKVDMSIPVDIETGVSGTYNVALTDYLFESGTIYGLQVYALAESGLSTTDLVSINVEYESVSLDGGYLLSTDIDEDTGIVNVQVDRDVTPKEGSLRGTWMFSPLIRADNLIEDDFEFTSKGKVYNSINIRKMTFISITITYFNGVQADTVFNSTSGGWVDDAYSMIEILSEPTDADFIEFLKANATLIEPAPPVPPTPIDITRALLYRVHDKERVFLTEVSEGDSFDDLLAPLNCNYMYELQMLTASGQISIVQLEVEQESIYSYIYYGDEIFKAKWNPEFDVSLGRPERKEQRYSGREYAVSYDSKAREETCKYGTVLLDRDDIVQLKEMMRAGGGHGIWKSADGDSYYANFEVSYQTNRYYAHQEWKVSLSVTRIEGKNGLQQQQI